MKTILASKVVRKLFILVFLVTGLTFIISNNETTQLVEAAPCCEDCPGGGDPGAMMDNCASRCGGVYSGACYSSCFTSGNSCYSSCVFCDWGGGGGGSYCISNADCDEPSGEFCIDGICAYSTERNRCNGPGYSCPDGSHCGWNGYGYFCLAN